MEEYYDKLFTLSREKWTHFVSRMEHGVYGETSETRGRARRGLQVFKIRNAQSEVRNIQVPGSYILTRYEVLTMNRLQRTLGKVCDNCPLCNYARANPETLVGKVMVWHGKYCPAWKAQQQIAEARQKERDQEKVPKPE